MVIWIILKFWYSVHSSEKLFSQKQLHESVNQGTFIISHIEGDMSNTVSFI